MTRALMSRAPMNRALLATLLVAGALHARPAAAERPTRVFAVVIGNNAPHTATAARLRYADDDALRMARLFEVLPGRVITLARPDPATRAAFPALAARARPPTKANLRAALDELAPHIEGARAAGWRTAFYLFFAGHGDRQHFAEAGAELSYVFLDQPLSSRDLYRLVDRVPADAAHVLIDACHALDVVTGRGDHHPDEPAVDLRGVVGDFLDAYALRGRPGVGVVVSTTPERTALESGALRGGIYTHVVRSGLLGGADLDGDGQVSYGELEAFAHIATTPTDGGARRVSFFVEPIDGARARPIVDLRRAQAPALHVPPEAQTRYAVQRADGAAYAGFYGAPNIATRLLLADPEALVLLRWDRRAERVAGELALPVAPPRTTLELWGAIWRPPGTLDRRDAHRGAADALFREPFGHTQVSRTLERRAPRPRDPPRRLPITVLRPQAEPTVEPPLIALGESVLRARLTGATDPRRVEVRAQAQDPRGAERAAAAARCVEGQCPAEVSDRAVTVFTRLTGLGPDAVQLDAATLRAGRVERRISRRVPTAPAALDAALGAVAAELAADLPPAAAAPQATAPPAPIAGWTSQPISPPTRAVPVGAWSALGGGALALAAGGWMYTLAADAAETHQTALDCFDCRLSARRSAERWSIASTAALAGGAALLVGGGLWALLGGDAPARGEPGGGKIQPIVGLGLTSGGWTLGLGGAF